MGLTVGQSLQKGKYILEEELGEGGFGRTYKAINQVLKQVVVIKTWKSGVGEKGELAAVRKEWLKEAQRLIKCAHPNIVGFYEFFIEEEIPYIVMDYIEGETLEKIVCRESPLAEGTAIEYIGQLGAALKVIHSKGLLHRDIKPENVILERESQKVVLIDFGIAREFNQGRVQTHTSIVSDGYAPIEQYLPKAPRSRATDIYGLAATLYTLVTGERPLPAPLRNRVSLSKPKEKRPELSNQISAAIMKGMALEIEERPSSIEEWLSWLPQPESKRSGSGEKRVLGGKESQQQEWRGGSQRKRVGYHAQIAVGLLVWAGMVWGVDYAWLRFESSSSQKKIDLKSREQVPQIDGSVTLPSPGSRRETQETKLEKYPPVPQVEEEPVTLPSSGSRRETQKTKLEKSPPVAKVEEEPVTLPSSGSRRETQKTKLEKYPPVPQVEEEPVTLPSSGSRRETQKTKLEKSPPVPQVEEEPVTLPSSGSRRETQKTKLEKYPPVPQVVEQPIISPPKVEQVSPPKKSAVNATPVPTIVYSPSEAISPPKNSTSRSEINSRSSRVEIDYQPNKISQRENRQIRIIRSRREQIIRKRVQIIRRREGEEDWDD